jgi:programmed cell death 6-interacting protein
MDLSGDGIKEASKQFQGAAAIFDEIKSRVGDLKPDQVTTDFTNESLSMLTNLSLAQAQYLFYKKASEAKMKPALLSKIAMQISEYFAEAHKFSQMNQGIRQYDGGKFSNIMLFYSHYFEASAYLVLAQHERTVVKEKATGAGKMVGLAQCACNKFMKMQTIASQVPSNYQGTHKNRLQEA